MNQHIILLIFLPSSFSLPELEAKDACEWLRAAGFPQYAQLYEGNPEQNHRSPLIPPFPYHYPSLSFAPYLCSFLKLSVVFFFLFFSDFLSYHLLGKERYVSSSFIFAKRIEMIHRGKL